MFEFWKNKSWRQIAGFKNQFEYIISYDFRSLNESTEEIKLSNRKEVIKTMLGIDAGTFFIAGPVTTTIVFKSSCKRNDWIRELDKINKFSYVLFLIDVDYTDLHLQTNYTTLNSNFLKTVNEVRRELKFPDQLIQSY